MPLYGCPFTNFAKYTFYLAPVVFSASPKAAVFLPLPSPVYMNKTLKSVFTFYNCQL